MTDSNPSLATEVNNLKAAHQTLVDNGADTSKLGQAIEALETKAHEVEAHIAKLVSNKPTEVPPGSGSPQASSLSGDVLTTTKTVGPEAHPAAHPEAHPAAPVTTVPGPFGPPPQPGA